MIKLRSLPALLALLASTAVAGELEWRMLSEQANMHLQRGSLDQAEMFAREAIAEAERSFGRSHRATDQSIATLGLVLRFAQRFPEAEKELRRALALREKSLGPGGGCAAQQRRRCGAGAEELCRSREAAPPRAGHF